MFYTVQSINILRVKVVFMMHEHSAATKYLQFHQIHLVLIFQRCLDTSRVTLLTFLFKL